MNAVKRCRVCGDQATGFNYRGLSCESCKVFFHRHANKEHKFKCRSNNGSCIITIKTRQKCQKCRLEACYRNGMVKREYGKKVLKSEEHDDDTTNQKLHLNSAESALEEGILKSITLYDVDYSRRRRREEDQELPPTSPLSLKRQSSKCSKNAAPTELTAFELEQIAFVGQAMSAFVDESTCPNVLVATSLAQCFQMPEVYIRWAIKFCKRFPAFSELSAANQFSIFKNFAYDILTIRMVFGFDLERNGALMFTTDAADEVLFVNFDLASEMKNTDLCKQQIDYCLKLYDGLEKDRTIHDLLSAQQLFANRSKAPLAVPEYFHYQHCFYSRLLRRYLESKHGLVLGRKKYSKLAELTAELDALKESEVQMYKTEIDLTTLPAVFLELYNLCT